MGKCPQKGKGGRGKAKATAKKVAGSSRRQTPAQQAMQKCRENLRALADEDKFVRILETAGRALKEQIEYDIIQRKEGNLYVSFGPSYYSDRTKEYAPQGSVFASLKPDAADESIVDEKLMSAISVFLKRTCFEIFFKIS